MLPYLIAGVIGYGISKLFEDKKAPKYTDGGLIAPNGKPSNLTPEQYKLVRTPAFKKWFGDWENDPANASKIVDFNGEPLVCYHGSNREFSIFDKNLIGSANDSGFYGKGFYFTFQKDETFMKSTISEAGYYGSNVRPFFINSLKPFNIDKLSQYKGISINYIGIESIVFLNNVCTYFPELCNIIKIIKNIYNKENEEYEQEEVSIGVLPNLIKKYEKELKLNIVENRWGEKNVKDGYVKSEIVEFDYTDKGVTTKSSYINNDYLGKWQFNIKDGVQYPSDDEIKIGLICEAIKRYDGIEAIFLPEGYMTRYPQITDAIKKNHDCIMQGETGDELVVFEPEQIKLADGTNKTFDGNNPDIRFMAGGVPKKVKFDIEEDEDEDEDRTEISIKGIGEVILTMTYPEYEFLDDIGEDGLEELGIEEGEIIGKIEHIQIEDKYKGQGYAKLLMKKAIEIAEEKGLMPLYLNASPMGNRGLDIDDLTAFYESFGFEVFLEQGNNNLMILK